MLDSLSALRKAYRGLAPSAHSQIGKRALKEASAIGDRNPARAAELTAKAAYHLPYAQEMHRRASSLTRYWAGSATASVMSDYETGAARTVRV